MATNGLTISDPFRTGKAYSMREVAGFAETTTATVRRWLNGYDAPGHHVEPVFGEREPGDSQVSFLELIDIIVAVRFRRDEDISLERVRRAHAYARKQWLAPFPFAAMRFKVLGGHIMHEFEQAEPSLDT